MISRYRVRGRRVRLNAAGRERGRRRAGQVGTVVTESDDGRYVTVRWPGASRAGRYPSDHVEEVGAGAGRPGRLLRLLARCRRHLRELNRRSDARLFADPDAVRSDEAQKSYDLSARIIRDIERETRR